MKKYGIFILIVVLSFSGLAFSQGLSIKVEPKIEALGILNYISGITDWPKNSEFLDYKEDINEYFVKGHNRKHPAIDMIQLLRTFGFKGEAPYLLLLHLSSDFKFAYPKKSFIQISKGIGIPTGALKEAFLKKFIFEFKAFYYDYKFETFYKKHENFYKVLENSIKDFIPIDLISVLEDFFKAKSLGYSVFLSPSLPKNYGLYIRTPYGFESFAIMGLSFLPKTEREKLEYVYQIIKELVRSFVEPIDYGYVEEIKRLKRIKYYNMTRKKLSTYKLINEIIVSAVASHLMKVLYSEKEESWAIVREESNGYYLVRPLAKFLEKYYRDIDNYKNFAQFYPQILSYLSGINSGKIKVEIPENMGSILEKRKKPAILLVDYNSLPKSIDDYLEKETEKFKKKGYNVIKVSMKDYLKNINKYRKRIPIIYAPFGKVEDFLLKLVPPIYLKEDKIGILDFSYNGKYIFIGKVPNFFMKNGDIILVTTNQDKLLEGIDVFDYLPFNYVVLNEKREIVQGGFQKFKLK